MIAVARRRGMDVGGDPVIDRLKELGCIFWFPLNAKGNLTDSIGGRTITNSNLTWQASKNCYYTFLGAAGAVNGRIALNLSESDFPDSEWTTVNQMKFWSGYGTTDSDIFILNNQYVFPCFNSAGSKRMNGWGADVPFITFTACSLTGRKVYVNGTLIADDSVTYEHPWGYSELIIGTLTRRYGFRLPFRNAMLFNKALSASEVNEVIDLIGSSEW